MWAFKRTPRKRRLQPSDATCRPLAWTLPVLVVHGGALSSKDTDLEEFTALVGTDLPIKYDIDTVCYPCQHGFHKSCLVIFTEGNDGVIYKCFCKLNWILTECASAPACSQSGHSLLVFRAWFDQRQNGSWGSPGIRDPIICVYCGKDVR